MIVKSTNKCSLNDGDILFLEGEASDCAYIVESGQLSVTTVVNYQTVELGILREGDIVGEMGIIDQAPRTATVTATGTTYLIAITRDSLADRLSDVDPIILFIVKTLLERYRSGLDSVRGKQKADVSYSMTTSVSVGKMRLEAELKDALENNRLEISYQPLLNIQTNTVAGFEALARWNHPVRGPILPEEFIALAEETSLIVPIGEYIFQQSCLELINLGKAAGRDDLFMSINVSARQILATDFLQRIAQICLRSGVRCEQIAIEITETMGTPLDVLNHWVKRCRMLGFKISIDDFGTGYSGLSLLTKLTPDKVKIDKLFIANIKTDQAARQLLSSIAQMLNNQQIGVVVEGVESQYELDFIRDLGCDYAQGYLVGKPLSGLEAIALFE